MSFTGHFELMTPTTPFYTLNEPGQMIGICIMDICMNSIYAYAILWYAAIGNAGAMTDGLCWIWSVVVSFLVFQSYWSCQLCSVILIFPEDVLLVC